MYLSFDVGIRNLAFCVYDAETHQIKEWGVIDLGAKKNLDDLTEILLEELCTRFEHYAFHEVLIENQPVMKNPRMKSIQMVIYTYFMMSRVIWRTNQAQHDTSSMRVVFVSATQKNKIAKQILGHSSTEKLAYKEAKKCCVEAAKALLKHRQADRDLSHLLSSSKKDDLADAYIQVVSYLSHHKSQSSLSPVLPKPPSPRSVESNVSDNVIVGDSTGRTSS